MIIIIEKNGYFKQMQIDDYFGSIPATVIDLREKNGKILYNKIFKRKRKSNEGNSETSTFNPYQKKLGDFEAFKLESISKSEPVTFKLPYRQKVRIPSPDEFMVGNISWAEIEALRNYEQSNGYLKDIFILNNFHFWDDVELTPEQEKIFGNFFIGDIVKLEIGRCKLGYIQIEDWVKDLETNNNLLWSFNLENERIPDVSNYGRLVTGIGSNNLRTFHASMVKEFELYELVDYQVGIWDGRFFKSNCSGKVIENTGTLSDPECGKYMKGKYKGPGYIESPIIDWKYNLIVYTDAIRANTNDKIAFRETFKGYINERRPGFKYFLADGGAGPSHENQELVHRMGSIPILRWKKSKNPAVIQVKKGYYFYTKYIPDNVIPHIGRIYNLRTKIERENSLFGNVYWRTRMPNRGKENALIFVNFDAITQGLTALTAYKAGRLDLINSATAFGDIYTHFYSDLGRRYSQIKNRQIYWIY